MLTVSSILSRLAPGKGVLLALFVAVTLPLHALELGSLYTVQVPFDPRDPASREAAYEDALQQILIRITGSEEAALAPELTALFPDPARYVMQFRPGEDNTLWVAMDGAAIENFVRQAGFPVWGSDRPATLIWLAVDWGQGDRELISADDPEADQAETRSINRDRLLRERIRKVAQQRGVPLIFPLLDTEDLNNISFTDVWGGFHGRLLEASRRYGAESILAGRLRPGIAQRNRWSFYFGGQQWQWSGAPEEAIHRFADTLAGQLALARNAPRELVFLAVSGVDSVVAYGEVQRLIAGVNSIEHHAIESVAGDRIRYRIEISGGAGKLGSVLDVSGKLERAAISSMPLPEPGSRDAVTLQYLYKP